MSLLTKASLVMTPNAVKESKVYSIIPSNGNGDLTFTRSTLASSTLNNDAGLIEIVPYNLLNYSEQFGNASWSNTELNVSGTPPYLNQGTSPNGSVTATKIIPNTVGGVHRFVYGPTITTSAGSSYTISIFMKKNDFNYCFFRENINGTTDNSFFNLQTVTLGTIGAGRTATIQDFGNGWIRCSVTATTTTTSINVIGIGVTDTNGNTTVIGDNIKFNYLWGAQLVQGSVPKDYFFTTDRLNVPRLNYDTVGGCPALLLEPQRTNLLLNSVWSGSSTSPTSWSLNGTGVSTRIASIKNPNVGAYNFVSTAIARIFFFQTQTFTINTTSCLSVYVESASVPVQVQFILAIINAVGTPTYFKNNVAITATTNIEAGNTYSIVYAASATTTISEVRVGLHNTGIVGNVTLSMPQLQTGLSSIAAYSTSFIPTTTGAVTRNADQFSRSNIYTNGLITSSGGAWYLEINNNLSLTRDNSGTGLYIGDSATTPNNSFGVINTGTGRLVINKKIAGTLTSLYTTTTNTIKVVFNWNGSTMDVFVNGTKQVTATTFTSTALEFLSAYLCYVPKYIKGIYLFPAPLTDTECTNLTA